MASPATSYSLHCLKLLIAVLFIFFLSLLPSKSVGIPLNGVLGGIPWVEDEGISHLTPCLRASRRNDPVINPINPGSGYSSLVNLGVIKLHEAL
ncbi:hypothetical protein Fmac_028394 [Flemingia macrophylla]|uniref:Uncharacterized protein n=1 Tax=Flemingia macrophylla TaxID=520843 RepID=A0ABD1L7C5_9FABA